MTKESEVQEQESQQIILEVNEMKIKWIDYRKWQPLQGELKETTAARLDKLLKSFQTKKGFVPAFVWLADDGTPYIMDAHQRQKMFIDKNVKFRRENGRETYQYPCVIVQADNFEDAQEKLLAIISQYGQTTQEGFDSFVKGLNKDWISETTTFSSFLSNEPGGSADGPTDRSAQLGDTYQVIINCTDESHQQEVFNMLTEDGFDCDIQTI